MSRTLKIIRFLREEEVLLKNFDEHRTESTSDVSDWEQREEECPEISQIELSL